jgi:hypothetical protein
VDLCFSSHSPFSIDLHVAPHRLYNVPVHLKYSLSATTLLQDISLLLACAVYKILTKNVVDICVMISDAKPTAAAPTALHKQLMTKQHSAYQTAQSTKQNMQSAQGQPKAPPSADFERSVDATCRQPAFPKRPASPQQNPHTPPAMCVHLYSRQFASLVVQQQCHTPQAGLPCGVSTCKHVHTSVSQLRTAQHIRERKIAAASAHLQRSILHT